MEPIYTAAQWVEIDRIERFSKRGIPPGISKKRAYAPHFAGGEFYLAWGPGVDGERDCWVFEALSGVVVTYTDSRVYALEDARRILSIIPRERMAAFFAQGRARMAAKEADAAITKAINKPKEPRKIGKRLREIFAAGNGRCHYCKADLELTGTWEVEHKMPKALGGSNERINLVASCRPCNRLKRDKTDVEFFALLAAKSPA